jgi:hypothetical protein
MSIASLLQRLAMLEATTSDVVGFESQTCELKMYETEKRNFSPRDYSLPG